MGASIQPRLARGTRDFSPAEMQLRSAIIQTISRYFQAYGFEQIETPAIENLETLMGKYGEEGDNLIFKILNSGDFLRGIEPDVLAAGDARMLTTSISEKALRYDLTVPFARYVVQHRNEINLPFRRYQIQPVWRADKPQKGRYREFYQCDADIIGSDSLLNEAELIGLVNDSFQDFGIRVEVKINNRKVLYGFCEANGISDQFIAFTVVLDKIEKKPWNEMEDEFRGLGFSQQVIENIGALVKFNGEPLDSATIKEINSSVKLSEVGQHGLDELSSIAAILSKMNLEHAEVKLDLSLARGLNYYTGAIIEVVAPDYKIGSICGGGRYDDLTGIFGWEGISGVGISFGIDRIFDILKESGWKHQGARNKVIVFANFGKEELIAILPVAAKLRKRGLTTIIYPDADKLKKQFKYADQRGATHMISAGQEEISKGVYRLKDLQTGDQQDLTQDALIQQLETQP